MPFGCWGWFGGKAPHAALSKNWLHSCGVLMMSENKSLTLDLQSQIYGGSLTHCHHVNLFRTVFMNSWEISLWKEETKVLSEGGHELGLVLGIPIPELCWSSGEDLSEGWKSFNISMNEAWKKHRMCSLKSPHAWMKLLESPHLYSLPWQPWRGRSNDPLTKNPPTAGMIQYNSPGKEENMETAVTLRWLFFDPDPVIGAPCLGVDRER